MSPKRASKTPPAPARSPAKKAPRPAATKKKQAPPKPAAMKEEPQPENQKSTEATQQLLSLLKNPSVSAQSIVDFVVGPTCGLESLHSWCFSNMTPFLLAVAYERLDVVQLLVAEHSANTKAVAQDNFTALHLASLSGNVWHDTTKSNLELVRYLVEQCGLDIEAVEFHTRTSLHLAIMNTNSEEALLLLELGADPNHSDRNLWTPLHYSCMRGLVDVTQVLMAKGASPAVVNTQGKSPLDIAVECQYREVVALLETRL